MSARKKAPLKRARVGPFNVTERPRVTRVRHVGGTQDQVASGPRQALPGFPDEYRDIVHYIVRITHRIWAEGAVELIYDTYDPECVVHSAADVSRGVEPVVAGTIAAMASFPEVEDHVLNVAWSHDEAEGFYTSHLGFSRVLNIGESVYGPATGRTAVVRYCADCVTLAGRIHTEWLARDNGAVVRQLGFDLHETARRLAALAPNRVDNPPVSTRSADGPSPEPWDLERGSLAAHLRLLFHDLWNRRRLDLLKDAYAPDVQVHTAGGRVACGIEALRALHVSLMASMPDCRMTVANVCWSDETDGIIAAVRWELSGAARAGGWLGAVPQGVPISIPGMTHCRFDHRGLIVEEWTVWDEVAVLAKAYRAA